MLLSSEKRQNKRGHDRDMENNESYSEGKFEGPSHPLFYYKNKRGSTELKRQYI